MAYRITGLDPARFAGLIQADDGELACHGAIRMIADHKPGFPCRVSLTDAEPGESVLLLQHVSHDVETPFRSAFAIYVRERARAAAVYVDRLPSVFSHRTMTLRGYDSRAMLRESLLAPPGDADSRIRALFADPQIAYIHTHYAAPGCFAAMVERSESDEHA